MTSIAFGTPPQFGDVYRDKDSGMTVMWLTATFEDSHALGDVVVLLNPPSAIYWAFGLPGAIETGISWIYLGWEKVE